MTCMEDIPNLVNDTHVTLETIVDHAVQAGSTSEGRAGSIVVVDHNTTLIAYQDKFACIRRIVSPIQVFYSY